MYSTFKKHIIVIILISFFAITNIYSIELNEDFTGFVIDSPLYTNFSDNSNIIEEYANETQTFNEQLGIFEQSEMLLNSELDLLQAISDSNYSITPGDTFQVDYLEGNESKEIILRVDSEYNLAIPLIGIINAEGKNLVEIKELIKNSISKYYAFSSPQVSFISLGIFSVDVIGEVLSSTSFAVNGLARLSDVVYIASDRANTRDIEIKDKNGNINHYDLYSALKEGQLDQNPLLKVGDTVILKKANKVVNIVGNVYEPGTYQVKDSETLKEIIDTYADGILPKADKDSLYISRYNNESNTYNEIDFDIDDDITINNLDTIIIPSIQIEKECVFIEGAISNSSITNENAYSQISSGQNKIIYNFYPEETLEEMLETISVRFVANSDLSHSYLIRNDEKISINILDYITQNIDDDVTLQAGDRIIIPFDNKYVNVQGEVERSGTFVYEPNKKLEYYISLAGGYTSDASDKITVTDSNGNRIDRDSDIPYDSTIYVKEDNLVANIALVSSIITIVYYTTLIVSNTVSLF
ncbi:MAG: polysaccharide biosynthesis/export family protein [Pleomorphochaeta sp.]